MELNEVLRFADEKVFSKTGKHLDDMQEAILKEVLQGRKYATKIAQDRDCTEGYVRVAASELWKILSKVFDEDVTKVNVRAILERAKFYTNFSSSVVSDNMLKTSIFVKKGREVQQNPKTPNKLRNNST